MDSDSKDEDLPLVLHRALTHDPVAHMADEMLEKMALAFLWDPQTWVRCKEVLKGFRGKLRECQKHVELRARELQNIRSIGPAPPGEISIIEAWPGAPCADDLYAPTGYQISPGRPAISRIEKKITDGTPHEKKVPVSLDPLLVTRRIGHMQGRSIMLEVQFRTHHGWRKVVQDREIFFSSRKIVDVGRFGLPVASDNALEVVAWLRHYEHVHRAQIPETYASSAMGWQGEEDNPTHHGFLCGVRQIGGNGLAIELEGGQGDMSEAKQIRPHGSFKGWLEAIKPLLRFSAVQLAIAAALAPPLIAVLDTENAIVEWAGRTSRGKSTVLRVAQSCWRSAGTRMATWNSTIMGVEAAAQFLCDMPLIIDDTSAAVDGGRSQSLGKVVYQLMSGRARGRATRDGTQKERPSWRTVVISSGEAPLGELARAEGAAARVLTFWSTPLGRVSPETGALAENALHEMTHHYGHAGPRVVQWLCENRDQWDDLRRLHEETAKRVRKKLPSAAAARLANVIALLEVSAYVGRASGATPWFQSSLLDDSDIDQALYEAMDLATSGADRAYLAWEHIMSIAESSPHSWIRWNRDPPKDRDPPGGWLGVSSATEFGWYPAQLRKALAQADYDFNTVLRAWRDLGILESPHSGYVNICRPYGGRETARLIRVHRSYPGAKDLDEHDNIITTPETR